MRAVSLALVTVVAAAMAAAQVNPANPAGDWNRDIIENRTTIANYEEEHILYGNYTNGTGWAAFSWIESSDLTPCVHVSRSKNVEAWDHIKVKTLNPTEAYYTAGWAEGYLTFDTIFVTFVNQVRDGAQQLSTNTAAQSFIDAHVAYERNHENTTMFGKQLHRQMRQIDGMYDGFVAGYLAAGRPENVTLLTWQDIYLVSYMEELENVLNKYPTASNIFTVSTKQQVFNSPDLHCSALMKLTEDDLFFAHDTWSGFNTMVRQFKTYIMPEATVVMSGYPGSISSIDDWYMTSHDMAVTETTNGFSTASLRNKILPQQVSEFNRVMIGNFIATSPLEWMQIFDTANSGTYNNQYMVADMKAARTAISNRSALPPGTFYVGEQIPGLIVYEDQTEFLNTHKHWPSYNIPFYRAIQEASGYDQQQAAGYYGMDNYDTYSRAVIFKRMQNEVTDMASMFYLMRYNNFQQDPASTLLWCKTAWNPNGTTDCHNATQSASQTIASRYDLNTPQESPGGDLVGVSRFMFGAVDTKVTSAFQMADGVYSAIAINGPTRVQQPVWDYNAFISKYPSFGSDIYYGLPNRYDFKPVFFMESSSATPVPLGPAPEDGDDDKKRNIAIGVGVAAAVCVLGVAGVIFFRMRSPAASSYEEGRALV